jgi:hypothetical protein
VEEKKSLEIIKAHILLESCVAIRFEMLTYYRVRSAFKTNRALLSNKIWAFNLFFNSKDVYTFFEPSDAF